MYSSSIPTTTQIFRGSAAANATSLTITAPLSNQVAVIRWISVRVVGAATANGKTVKVTLTYNGTAMAPFAAGGFAAGAGGGGYWYFGDVGLPYPDGGTVSATFTSDGDTAATDGAGVRVDLMVGVSYH